MNKRSVSWMAAEVQRGWISSLVHGWSAFKGIDFNRKRWTWSKN